MPKERGCILNWECLWFFYPNRSLQPLDTPQKKYYYIMIQCPVGKDIAGVTKRWYILETDPSLKQCFNKPPCVAYKRLCSLSEETLSPPSYIFHMYLGGDTVS